MITLFRSKDCDGIISLEIKEKEAKEYFDIFDKNTDLYISRQEVSLQLARLTHNPSLTYSLTHSYSMVFNFS